MAGDLFEGAIRDGDFGRTLLVIRSDEPDRKKMALPLIGICATDRRHPLIEKGQHDCCGGWPTEPRR
jgi:hypothetical protein